MRVNLQTGFNYTNHIYKAQNTSFRGEKTKEGAKDELKFIALKSDKSTKNPIYENGYNDGIDVGYDMGYQDAKKNSSKGIKAALIALAALQAASLYQGVKTDAAILDSQGKIIESQIDLYNGINHLHSDINYGNQVLLEQLVDITYMLDGLSQQKNILKEQIEALPEDSDEAIALKEELRVIEEQYKNLLEEYWDYISEYNEQNENGEDEDSKPDTNDSFFNGPLINVNTKKSEI